ncbi:atrial natriuretic peptide receptor 1-like [Paramacrobiotus metropolitanus]|uniref:atrial natriuretic peptide receptor 1-like n=1 Tax=Paramacrobiotus metropolitanus TaxID=2943436 RepID=UPI002445DC78|nr:atrial natriuretic peptide receptor 1-like [Paramacrobiotus metropolitanus]
MVSLCYLVPVVLTIFGTPRTVSGLNVSIVVISYIGPLGFPSLVYSDAPLSMATEYVGKLYNTTMTFNLHFLYDPAHPTCADLNDNAVRLLGEWQYRMRKMDDFTVYIIPACVEATEIPYLQAQWDTLWISSVSASAQIRHRDLYPTWISTNYISLLQLSELYVELLNKYAWTSVTLVIDTVSPPFFFTFAESLLAELKENRNFSTTVYKTSTNSPGRFTSILEDIQQISRVVLFFGHARFLRDFMITASQMHMTDGNYVALQAFQSLLVLHPRDVDESPDPNLGAEFIRRSQLKYNFTYTLAAQGRQKPQLTGSSVVKYLVNRTFTDGSAAGSIYIDKNGQSRRDLAVSYYTPSGHRKALLLKIATNETLIQVVNLTAWSGAAFPPPSVPYCGYKNSKCSAPGDSRWIYGSVLGCVCVMLCVGVLLLYYARQVKRKADTVLLYDPWWQIASAVPHRSFHVSTLCAFGRFEEDYDMPALSETLGVYQGKSVRHVKLCQRDHTVTFGELSTNIDLLQLMKKFHGLDHHNLCRFYGIAISVKYGEAVSVISAVTEHPARGTLIRALSSSITQDFAFSSSLIIDYLEVISEICSCGKCPSRECDKIISSEMIFWLTPERANYGSDDAMQAVDIYSSGYIIYEILTNGSLFYKLQSMSKNELCQLVADGAEAVWKILDYTGNEYLTRFAPLLQLCWSSDPVKRPKIQKLRSLVLEILPLLTGNTREHKVIDAILKRLANYAEALENEVIIKTKNLCDEIAKCDAIVAQFLPRTIVKQLRTGHNVQPELFQCVTIMFMELSGFSDFVNSASPEKVLALLSETESFVDRLLMQCDVYKIEAVADTYLIGSGLPERNGNHHVCFVAMFALKLLNSGFQLILPEHLGCKIGINSGPCAAGLVGLRRFRYCLFGNTVNIASRMCSQGLPGRIQLSASSQLILQDFPEFRVALRGIVHVKGTSRMLTYWLLGLTGTT